MDKHIIITSIIILWCCSAIAQERKVAVFDPAGDVTSSIKEIVREEISATIVNIDGYTVLERQLINKVLEENKFQMGGLVDDSQISEVGKRMGANYVLVSSVTSLGTDYYISCKMIEVLTARIDKQKTARTKQGATDIIEVVQDMVRNMFGLESITAKQTPVTEKTTQTAAIEKSKAKIEDDESECGFELKSCLLVIACRDLYSDLSWHDAIKHCPKGWRLPTLDELKCMSANQQRIPYFNKREYWSSTEKGDNAAYSVTLNDGKAERNPKGYTRAVRYVKDY
ncbi:MAG: hypothetical protein LBI60_05205 [Bacteroidales bacterium]|jgi:hypothetical protein|nr:hypothetical protein [Bacteroidales bacterium]